MTKKISIDPVTRIEGHLAIETTIEGGRVASARVAGRMYRGFEQLLLGRHPVDAARITQRICGICHEVHGIAASIALEDLYKLTPTDNGFLLRELILGLHLVTDHIFHFYQLLLPDYLDFKHLAAYSGQDNRIKNLVRMQAQSKTFQHRTLSDAVADTTLTAEMGLGYIEAINVRKEAGSGLASLGGKVPFCHSILPGGLTTDVTSDRLMNYGNALKKTADFVERFFLPQAIALAENFPQYFSIGAAHGNFYGNGGFSRLDKPLFTAGIMRSGQKAEKVDFGRIAEVAEASYFDPAGSPQQDKPGAYSWVKAMHYDGLPMEVGPLARLVVGKDRAFRKQVKKFGQGGTESSVMMRILARAVEAEKICSYLQELLPQYRAGEATIQSPDMLLTPTGEGRGMSIAARGALNHEISTEKGKVTRYRLQVPSAWNFGPTVKKVRGPVEEALVGTEVRNKTGRDAIEVGRIVRSFDPCLACAIH